MGVTSKGLLSSLHPLHALRVLLVFANALAFLCLMMLPFYSRPIIPSFLIYTRRLIRNAALGKCAALLLFASLMPLGIQQLLFIPFAFQFK